MRILNDFQTSVRRALDEIDPKWETYPGLIICGSHSPKDTDEMLLEIKKVRETSLPFLGICAGHQLAAIEYARNVLGIKYATSEEYGPSGPSVVHKLPKLKVGVYDGESYWNNYEVNSAILKLWVKADNFITCQFHPEYQSSKGKHHPLLVTFLKHAKSLL